MWNSGMNDIRRKRLKEQKFKIVRMRNLLGGKTEVN